MIAFGAVVVYPTLYARMGTFPFVWLALYSTGDPMHLWLVAYWVAIIAGLVVWETRRERGGSGSGSGYVDASAMGKSW